MTFTRRTFVTSAAASSAAASSLQTGSLRAGAATSNITLPLDVWNGGVILRGSPARRVHDELHARCLALNDGPVTIAIAVCDSRMISREVVDRARQLTARATGVPPENLLVSATHSHAAPAVMDLGRSERDAWYADFVAERIADGMRQAIGNIAPARIGWSSVSAPGEVFNRRWFIKGAPPPNPFGGTDDRVVMNPGDRQALLKAAGPVDPELFLVSVQHADGRPLALLANYGLHYVGGYEPHSVSADYFAVFADRMQELIGADRMDPPFVAMMSNGTSGDVNNIDFRKPRQQEKPWTRMRAVAFRLADAAFRGYRDIQYRDRAPLTVASSELQLGVRRPDPARLAWARDVLDGLKNPDQPTRPEIYAGEAVALSKYPPAMKLRLQAIRIGELGIAAIPCEVFAETGLAIKAQSPLRPTFTIELANGYNGYLPTPQQHEWGGYETWPARSAYLEPGAEPQIRAGVLALLSKLSA